MVAVVRSAGMVSKAALRRTVPCVGMASVPEPSKPNATSWERLVSLMTTPGTGQVRRDLAADERRVWSDLQLTSHAAFVPGIVVAAARDPPLPELVVLQSAVLSLSLLYHWNYERPGLLAKGEGLSAKMLFLYGATQTFRSPDAVSLAANSCCFALTLGAFVATNFDKRLYERWHPLGLHAIPGLWSTVVAFYNAPLLPPALVPAAPLISVTLPFLQ